MRTTKNTKGWAEELRRRSSVDALKAYATNIHTAEGQFKCQALTVINDWVYRQFGRFGIPLLLDGAERMAMEDRYREALPEKERKRYAGVLQSITMNQYIARQALEELARCVPSHPLHTEQKTFTEVGPYSCIEWAEMLEHRTEFTPDKELPDSTYDNTERLAMYLLARATTLLQFAVQRNELAGISFATELQREVDPQHEREKREKLTLLRRLPMHSGLREKWNQFIKWHYSAKSFQIFFRGCEGNRMLGDTVQRRVTLLLEAE